MTRATRTGPDAAGILSRLARLLRLELDLARAGIEASLGRAGRALGLLAGALVATLALFGVNPLWAATCTGLALAVTAWLLLRKGLNDLTFSNLSPSRSRDNLQRDARTIKETLT